MKRWVNVRFRCSCSVDGIGTVSTSAMEWVGILAVEWMCPLCTRGCQANSDAVSTVLAAEPRITKATRKIAIVIGATALVSMCLVLDTSAWVPDIPLVMGSVVLLARTSVTARAPGAAAVS